MSLKPDLLITLDGVNDFVTTTKMHKPGVSCQSGCIALGVDHPILNAFASLLRKSQFINSLNKLRERMRLRRRFNPRRS